MAGHLPTSLVDLHPSGLNGVSAVQGGAYLAGLDIGCETIVALVRHPDHLRLVPPGNSDQYRAKDFLTGQTSFVKHARRNLTLRTHKQHAALVAARKKETTAAFAALSLTLAIFQV